MFFQYPVDEHITLELQSPFHARELFDLVNENRQFIGKHLSWALQIDTRADMSHYLRRDLMGMSHERRWAWVIRYDGRIVGRIGLFVSVPELQECEMYYFLGKPFTGKGIVTKAAKVIVDFAFNVLSVKHMLIGFSQQNPKSGEVAKRLGFQYEYTLRDAELHNKEWRSLHFWGMLAEDWISENTPTFNFALDTDLTLRLYQPFQSPEKFKIMRQNQQEFSTWFWWATDNFTLAKERQAARLNLKRYMKQSGIAVTIWQQKQMVGHASLSIDTDNNSGNVGYWLDGQARGQGIMTRTVQALLTTAFTQHQVERMRILAASANVGSRAIAERIGMQLELVQKDETLIGGRFTDHVQYSILRSEWETLHA